MQGLQTLWKVEKGAVLRPDHRLSDQAIDVLGACVDTFGRSISNSSALMKLMAVLEPINDHAFSLPVWLLSPATH